jgi:hypothetical protein
MEKLSLAWSFFFEINKWEKRIKMGKTEQRKYKKNL